MSARLVIVQGDEMQADRLAESLRAEGFEATSVNEREAVLSALQSDDAGPDSVFSGAPTPPPRPRPSLARAPSRGSEAATGLRGGSPAMVRLRDLVARLAASSASVLIQGETGTGKELVARALHDLSSRSKGPFVAIDCATLPTTLLESELFGHAKGAFTDARASKVGLFAEAAGGTLFFDEVAELSLDGQAKLLRSLQERKMRPLGSNREVSFDARVVCATHKNLPQEVAAGRFREDLYFRLKVLQVELPPLRTRGMDAVHLAGFFLERICGREGRAALSLPPAVATALLHHEWPGNVRELESCVENLAALASAGQVSLEDLPPQVRRQPRAAEVSATPGATGLTLDSYEREYVLRVLESVHDNRSRAAEVLGIDRRTLYRKLETWGLPTWREAPGQRAIAACAPLE
jgi:two-component system response regulator HydG